MNFIGKERVMIFDTVNTWLLDNASIGMTTLIK